MSEETQPGALANVVEEVRAARAAVLEEAGGFAALGEYLRQIEVEFRTRTGRFSDIPTERPDYLERLIESGTSDDALLNETRALRSDSSAQGGASEH
jgi:hypothetical protein